MLKSASRLAWMAGFAGPASMDLRQLRYFARIVELESITAAAEALHIAQPSLSQHVANLEAELDAKLLVRGPSGTRPTETGHILYRHAKMVLRQMEEARAAVRYGRDVPSGHVTVGLPTSTSRVLALPLLQEVVQQYPDVTLEIVEASSADLAESVALQRLDVAIAMDVQQRVNMHVLPLLDETLLLVGPALAGNKSAVTLDELAALPLLLPSFPNSIRMLFDRAFVAAGLELNLVAESSAAAVLLAAARAGLGWTVLPWCALAENTHGLVGVPIADPSLRRRRMSLCTSASARLSLAGRCVEDTLLALIQRLVTDGSWQQVELIATTNGR